MESSDTESDISAVSVVSESDVSAVSVVSEVSNASRRKGSLQFLIQII